MKAKATINGAISIVNAIATGKGSTLGISLKTEAIAHITSGSGIRLKTENKTISSRLINKVIEKVVSKKDLQKNQLTLSLKSEVPTGYGLKSSSAISTAVAMVCAKIFRPKWAEQQILQAGVDASIETRVSITGAYDDACGCYYGGFVVTDNLKRKLVKQNKGPKDLVAVIFIPRARKRGKVKNLKKLSPLFQKSWELARKSDYWNAMVLNGLATSTILNSDPRIIAELLEAGATGASVSGNGPAIAAVTKKDKVSSIKKVFSSLEGRTIVSKINNKKAVVYEL